MNITPNDFGILATCAIRYCRGKPLSPLQRVVEIVKQHLPEMPDTVLDNMEHDNRIQKGWDLYGDPVLDKPIWMDWKEAVETEQKRRKKR